MKVVAGLLMVLLRVSCSVETYCDGRKDKAQCFGALGGTMALQLMDKVSEILKYKWMKEAAKNETTQIILHYHQTNNITSNSMSSRSVFFPGNGTFKINNLSRSDTGNYTLQMFDANGKQIGNRTLQVSIEAPLSSVHMTSECVSHGLIRVSCLSEGEDSPQYTWSLNGNKTRNTEIVERNTENNVIILKQNISGYLVCTARNHISHVSKEGMIPVCKDEDTHCNISEDGDGGGCYGALRGTVVIQLMKNTSETPRYEWKNKTLTILRGHRNNYFPDTLKDRFLFIPMYGTFSIMNLSKADSGQYTLETFDSDGKNIKKKTLQLIVQAPVSSVQLVPECLSQGEMKVSCLSEGGDSLQYKWTLDGNTLTDYLLFPENHETNVIVLRQNISGRLVCSVWNRFSFLSTEKTISTWGCTFINCSSNGTQISGWVLTENNILCVDSVVALGMVMTSILSALVFFLAVAIGCICAKKKTHTYKVEKDNSEPVYAEVRVVPQQERQTEETVEEEVDYKQVTFSELPQQTVKAEHPVYAQVCKVR